jgi:hypothetical protein
LDAAHRDFSQALSIQEDLRHHFATSITLENLAIVAILQNDIPGAKELCSRGLRIAHRERFHAGVTYFLLLVAVCLSKTGATAETAAVLLGCADGIIEELGLSFEETETKLREESLALLKHTIGEQGFDTAYAYGRTLTLDAAVALALHADN